MPHDAVSEGALNAALANEIGRIVAAATGRGATRSRAFIDNDVVVCLLEDSATKAERTLLEAGKSELVRFQRDAIQRAMEPELNACVERLTGRRVLNFLSGTSTNADAAVEVFLLAPATDPAA